MAGLTTRALGAAYDKHRVLDGIDLPELAPGTVTSLIGPNAAGKSTLLRALAGLRAYTGSVLLDGVALERQPSAARARRIAYLPQTPPGSAALTVYESVIVARRASGISRDDDAHATNDILVRLGIDDIAFRYLDELSGGQRQLVGIAQALVRWPEILLLDEPTSSLDLHRQIEVLDLVRTAAKERSLVAVVAIHDLNLALRFCDHVAVLSGGRIKAFGKPLEAVQGDVLRETYGVEARVEQCSRGYPIVVVDKAVRKHRAPELSQE